MTKYTSQKSRHFDLFYLGSGFQLGCGKKMLNNLTHSVKFPKRNKNLPEPKKHSTFQNQKLEPQYRNKDLILASTDKHLAKSNHENRKTYQF